MSYIKCHLIKYGAFWGLFWDKMYILFGSTQKSTLRSQRVNKSPCDQALMQQQIGY